MVDKNRDVKNLAPEIRTKKLAKSSEFKSFIKRRWRKIVLIVVFIAVIILAFGYYQTRSELNRLSKPGELNKSEAQKLTAKIDDYLDLPQNEVPTLVVVNDASKLQTEKFFARAKNGDKVLIYSKAERAVLYRPSTDKVIEYTAVSNSVDD